MSFKTIISTIDALLPSGNSKLKPWTMTPRLSLLWVNIIVCYRVSFPTFLFSFFYCTKIYMHFTFWILLHIQFSGISHYWATITSIHHHNPFHLIKLNICTYETITLHSFLPLPWKQPLYCLPSWFLLL